MAAAVRKGTREVVGLTASVSEASVKVAKTQHRGSFSEQTGVYNAPRRAIEAADRVEGSISTDGQNASAEQSRGRRDERRGGRWENAGAAKSLLNQPSSVDVEMCAIRLWLALGNGEVLIGCSGRCED